MPNRYVFQIRHGTSVQWAAVDPVLAEGEMGYNSTTNTLRCGDGVKRYSQLSDIGAVGGGGVSDGDKGDVVVSAGGTVWTIDTGVVSTSKMGGDVTAAGKALLDDADAAAQHVTLALGDAATKNVGTSSGTVAAGDHTHTGVYQPTGDYASAVHSHAVADVAGLQAALDAKAAATDPRLSDARTPLAHTHSIAGLTGLQTALDAKLNANDASVTNSRTPTAHTHPVGEIVGLGNAAVKNVGTTVGTVAAGDHLHSGVYQPAGNYAPTVHSHVVADVTGLQTALDAKLAVNDPSVTNARAPTAHTHPVGEVTGLGGAATKNIGTTAADVAAGNHLHTGVYQPVGSYAAAVHTHATSDVTGLDAALAGKLAANDPSVTNARTPTAHTHPTSDVTGLDAALSAKAPLTHVGDVTHLTAAQQAAIAGTSGTAPSGTNKLVDAADVRLNNARTPTAHTHPVSEITGLGALATMAYPALTNASAFITAGVSISTATYADVTGASLNLAAGTWLLIGVANFSSVNAAAILNLAVTDGANAILAEASQGVPASGTASVAQVGNVAVHAIVSPVSPTTYKLRGARGLTTLTGTVTVMNGAATNTTNNLTNGSNKGTGLIAVRIA